jgi:hypothetical protein
MINRYRLGEALDKLAKIADFRTKRCDAILDAYIRSGKTGRSYEEERNEVFRERGLGNIED